MQLKISRRHMGPIFSSDLRSEAKRRWTKSKIDFCFLIMHELTNYWQLSQMFAVVMMQPLKKKRNYCFFLSFGLQVIDSQCPRPAGSSRDHVLGRPCTPIHCLCDAYLGYTHPCYKVALQSVIIANTLDWMACPLVAGISSSQISITLKGLVLSASSP